MWMQNEQILFILCVYFCYRWSKGLHISKEKLHAVLTTVPRQKGQMKWKMDFMQLLQKMVAIISPADICGIPPSQKKNGHVTVAKENEILYLVIL